MKKIFNLILCVSLALGILQPVYASDNKPKSMDRAINLLEKIGIIEFDDNGSVDTEADMSRATFSDYMAKLIKVAPINDDRINYVDVQHEYWAFKSINALYDSGIISSDGERLFRPDDTITYSEACKMLLTAAGYNTYALANGGYPNGYIQTATKLDISYNASEDGKLNVGQALGLICDVATVGIYNIDSISGNDITFEVSEDKTLLSVYWNIKENVGKVNALYGMTLDKSINPTENTVYIDDEKYEVADGLEMEQLLGNKIDFFYEEDDLGAYKGKIIYAELKSKKENIDISSELISGFDINSYTLTYFTDDNGNKTKNLKIDKDALIIYNGMPTLRSMNDIISEFTDEDRIGSMHILYDGSSYNTVIAESFMPFVLRYSDINSQKLYDELNSVNVIDITEYETVIIENEIGEKINFSELKQYDALSVAESDDKEILKIKSSSTTVTSKLIGAESSVNGYIQLEDKSYKTDNVYFKLKGNDLKVGNSYKFVIDCFGRIAYAITDVNNTVNAGYLVSAAIDGPDIKSRLKIFNSQGEMKIYDLANSVKVDGNKYKGGSLSIAAIDAIPGTSGIYNMNDPFSSVNKPIVEKQVILFGLNNEGEINMIDTAFVSDNENPDNTLTKTESLFPKKLSYHISASKYYRFDRDVLYSKNDSLLLCVPYTDANGYLLTDDTKSRKAGTDYAGTNGKIKASDENYSVNDVQILSGRAYIVEGYNYNSSNPYNDIVLLKKAIYETYDSPIMVSEILNAMDSDEKPVSRIKGFSEGNEIICDVENPDEILGLKQGDLIIGSYSGDKKLANIKKVYDVESEMLMNKPGTYPETPWYWYDGHRKTSTGYEYYNVGWQLSLGYVTEKIENMVKWSYEYPDGKGFDEAYDLSVIPVTVYDSELRDDNVYKGTVSDIKDYKGAGADCSRIILFSRSGTVKSAYIFK